MKSADARVDCAIVFALSMLVYLATICPNIAAGDSGDFVTAAYTLGIAHPAGYPLYVLSGKLFTFIPYGSIAFRVNLLSAAAASLTAVLCCLSVRLLTGNRLAAVGAGLLAAYSRELWNQALVAEAYTLHALFIAMLIYLALLWRKRKDGRYLQYFALAYGLGLANHLSLAFYMPAFAYFIYRTDRKALMGGVLGRMGVLFAAGLLLYLYLPLRAWANPVHNWGDPSTPSRFFDHVSGFVHRQLYAYPNVQADYWGRFVDTVWQLFRQYSLVWVLAFIGYNAVRKDKRLVELTLVIAAIDAAYTIFLNVVSMEITAFEMPTVVALSIWLGFGLARSIELLKAKKNFAVGVAVVAVAAAVPLAVNYDYNNCRGNYIVYDYGTDILDTLDHNAVIFADGDNTILSLTYMLLAEKQRPDVTLIERTGFLSHEIYGKDFLFLPESEHQRRQDDVERKYIEGGRPVYYSVKRDMKAFPGKDLVQTGLVFKVVDVNESIPERDYWSGYRLRGSEDPSVSKDYMTRDVLATYHTRKGEYFFKKRMMSEAIAELSKAGEENPDNPVVHYNLGNIYLTSGMPDKAAVELEKTVALNPNDPNAHNNLGNAYLRLKRIDDAGREFVRAVQLDPAYMTARLNLAGFLFGAGKAKEALNEYIAIIKQDPSYASAYLNAGEIYYRAGMRDKAAEYWGKYVQLEPDSQYVKAIRDKLAGNASANKSVG